MRCARCIKANFAAALVEGDGGSEVSTAVTGTSNVRYCVMQASDATTVGARIRREPDAMAAPVAVGVAEARIDL